MTKRPKIAVNAARFWAGVSAEEIVKTILPDLEPFFEFEISASPQVVLYGPYPGRMPAGRYVKVFIGCECVRPIMSECDWAFGVLNEHLVGHARYMRIGRWGDHWDIVQEEKDWQELLKTKTRFCAFVYSHPVYYREAFYRALSRYKRIDSPGQSMNNMAGIDPVPGIQDWNAKIEFLRRYKFVIAFENESWAGYHSEKLPHAIRADCLPIYWGDPEVGNAYNANRILNAMRYLPRPRHFLPRLPESLHSLEYDGRRTLAVRAIGRINSLASEIEQRTWALTGFDALIEKIIQIDRDDDLYLRYLREPFLIGNEIPDRTAWIARWKEIFHSVPQASAP